MCPCNSCVAATPGLLGMPCECFSALSLLPHAQHGHQEQVCQGVVNGKSAIHPQCSHLYIADQCTACKHPLAGSWLITLTAVIGGGFKAVQAQRTGGDQGAGFRPRYGAQACIVAVMRQDTSSMCPVSAPVARLPCNGLSCVAGHSFCMPRISQYHPLCLALESCLPAFCSCCRA